MSKREKVLAQGVDVVSQYMPTPWHVIDTRHIGGDGWEIWDGLNRTVSKVPECDLPYVRMCCAAFDAAAEVCDE